MVKSKFYEAKEEVKVNFLTKTAHKEIQILGTVYLGQSHQNYQKDGNN